MQIASRWLRGLSLAAALLVPGLACADTIIFVTRHAEKAADGKDPELTAQGRQRAQNIATLLAKAEIKQIFSTNYARTKGTAQPLASALALPLQTYDPKLPAKLVEQVKALGGTTLVVGHSNTVPELVRLLGGKPGAEMPETEFDRLYQLIVAPDGAVTTLMLQSWGEAVRVAEK